MQCVVGVCYVYAGYMRDIYGAHDGCILNVYAYMRCMCSMYTCCMLCVCTVRVDRMHGICYMYILVYVDGILRVCVVCAGVYVVCIRHAC